MEPKIATVSCKLPFYIVPEQTIVKNTLPKPNFDISPIELKSRFLTVTDCQDAMPHTLRHSPILPAHATKSGHCDMAFRINKAGEYTNIKTFSCSDPIFAKPSIEAMKRWRKNICGSENEIDTDLVRTTSITYRLVDKNGNTITE